MKRTALFLAIVLGSVTLYAQQPTQGTEKQDAQGMEMTGTICDSKCVTQTSGQSACDQNCTEKSGEAVFIGDTGKVTKIDNPDKVKGYMGKHVKTRCKMMENSRMFIYSIYG